MSRRAEIERTTSETSIRGVLDLDGTGVAVVESGLGFLDHMLTAWAKHGRFDLELTCRGDLEVDEHHSVEDCAIVLGRAFAAATADKAGIERFGTAFVPMDEALVRAVVDLSGRPHLTWKVPALREMIGDLPVELAPHFWRTFTEHARVTLHLECLDGDNQHHVLESVWKASARALAAAVSRRAGATDVPSTKGTLDG